MATVTLRPNGAGSLTELTPSAGANWENVDEAVQDGDTSYNIISAATGTDLYAMQDHTTEAGVINSVKVYVWCDRSVGGTGFATIKLKSGATTGNSAEKTITTEWSEFSNTWATNPDGGGAWGSDWSVIDALEAGLQIRAVTAWADVTQVYIVVDYTPAAGRSRGYIIG